MDKFMTTYDFVRDHQRGPVNCQTARWSEGQTKYISPESRIIIRVSTDLEKQGRRTASMGP
jgi:hypothetical protein